MYIGFKADERDAKAQTKQPLCFERDLRDIREDIKVLDTGLYFSLFCVAFLAATLLPAQSELGLATLVTTTKLNVWLLVCVASAGNTLGSVVNWALGKGVYTLRDKKWFPISRSQLDKATRWYSKFGRWSLLFSWVPMIGDPLTMAAGVLREPLWSFVLLVALAKTLRYVAVVLLTMSLI